jgi:hypothetical protein
VPTQDDTSRTPAQEQAVRLLNLANHLLAHPDLSTVVVHRGLGLQLHSTARNRSATELLAWAETMHDLKAELQVHNYNAEEPSEAYVRITGYVGGLREQVWDTVAGLREHVADLLDAAGMVKDFDLDVLRCFADKGATA